MTDACRGQKPKGVFITVKNKAELRPTVLRLHVIGPVIAAPALDLLGPQATAVQIGRVTVTGKDVALQPSEFFATPSPPMLQVLSSKVPGWLVKRYPTDEAKLRAFVGKSMANPQWPLRKKRRDTNCVTVITV